MSVGISVGREFQSLPISSDRHRWPRTCSGRARCLPMVIPGRRAGSEFCSPQESRSSGFILPTSWCDGNSDSSLPSAAGSRHPRPGLVPLSGPEAFPSACQPGAASQSQNVFSPQIRAAPSRCQGGSAGSSTVKGVWPRLRS